MDTPDARDIDSYINAALRSARLVVERLELARDELDRERQQVVLDTIGAHVEATTTYSHDAARICAAWNKAIKKS